ncbi:MAG: hypothetical protein GY769_05085 [bacterium]|nr:hypothetical protein [bacterium]
MAVKRIGKSEAKPERDYSAGVRSRDLPGLWRRDWHRAYAILTRDHAEEEEPRGWFSRTWYRGKTLFLELSYKLSPPRRARPRLGASLVCHVILSVSEESR